MVEIPIGFLKRLFQALDEAAATMKNMDWDSPGPDDTTLEVANLDEALIKVLEHHPEPEVGKWYIGEIKKLEKEAKDGSSNVQ